VSLCVALRLPRSPASTLITLQVPCSRITMPSSPSPHRHFGQGISSADSSVRQSSRGCQQNCRLVLLPMWDARLLEHPQSAFRLAGSVPRGSEHSCESARRRTHCLGGTWSYMGLPKCSFTFLSESGPLSDTLWGGVIFVPPALRCVLEHHLIWYINLHKLIMSLCHHSSLLLSFLFPSPVPKLPYLLL